MEVDTIRREDIREACRRHLQGKHTTLYGQFHIIKGGDNACDEATDWLDTEVVSVLKELGIEPE